MLLVDRIARRLGFVAPAEMQAAVDAVIRKAQGESKLIVPEAGAVGYDVPAGTSSYMESYGQAVWVYACASIIASTAAEADLKLYAWQTKKGERVKTEIVDHPFRDLMKSVNPFVTAMELREITFLHLELAGNAYWAIMPNGVGKPAEIWPLSPHLVRVIPDRNEFIRGYLYMVEGEDVAFTPDEIIHFKQPNPLPTWHAMFYGLSTVAAIALSVATDISREKWDYYFFSNGARVDGVLETEEPMEDDLAKTYQKRWEKAHRGVKKAHRIAVLANGLKYKAIATSPKDMDFPGLAQVSRDRILAGFGVPASKLGLVEDVNRANADANDLTFRKDVVAPKLKRMQERITAFLLPKWDPRLFAEFEDIVPENRELKLKEDELHLKTGARVINELRERDGLKPVPWGNVAWLPISVAPATALLAGDASDTGQGQEGGKTAPPTPTADPNACIQAFARTVQQKRIQERLNRITPEERWNAWINRTEPQERKFLPALRRCFGRQQDEVLANLEAQRQAGYVRARDQINIEAVLFDETAADAALQATARPHVLQGIKLAGDAAIAELGLDIAFDVEHPGVVTGLKRQLEHLKKVNDTTREALRQTLLDGITAGEGIPELRDRITAVYAAAKGSRAETIARTEINAAAGQGTLEAYKQADVVQKKEWVAAGDERSRDSHIATMEAGPTPLNKPFDVGGYAMMHPSDSGGPAHEVINCRCALAPVTYTDEE